MSNSNKRLKSSLDSSGDRIRKKSKKLTRKLDHNIESLKGVISLFHHDINIIRDGIDEAVREIKTAVRFMENIRYDFKSEVIKATSNSRPKNINELPFDVIALVLKNFKLDDVIVLRLVCKHWKRYVCFLNSWRIRAAMFPRSWHNIWNYSYPSLLCNFVW